jgi:hypothetical protein
VRPFPLPEAEAEAKFNMIVGAGAVANIVLGTMLADVFPNTVDDLVNVTGLPEIFVRNVMSVTNAPG